ncbi:hypothetical protein I9018_06270 [Pseudomonas sp. MPFS]|uniref:hypothetical protein n=1 Tax=Pseudomonas sp. MPFS TaxID=2795724 RepID=UPI001F129E4C|nr:hypothetical protein [Pseudomonas sp. MPFS]UMZ13306.1 hypothetical protein I9018_06270 [Pseudomonas sp. MPFS]
MSFGVRTKNKNNDVISEFSGRYLRFVKSIRVEALQKGSFTFSGDPKFTRYFFIADQPVSTVPPFIDISGNTISWRPYATSPAFHVGGYILLGAYS